METNNNIKKDSSYNKILHLVVIISIILFMSQIIINPIVFSSNNGFASIYWKPPPEYNSIDDLWLFSIELENHFDDMIEFQILVFLEPSINNTTLFEIYSKFVPAMQRSTITFNIENSLLNPQDKIILQCWLSNEPGNLAITFTVPL